MRIVKVDSHFELYDGRKFICSADTEEEAMKDRDEYLERRERKNVYVIHFSIAKGRWITTENGEKIQVPVEESRHLNKTVEAHSEREAINSIKQDGYIVTNIHFV